MKILVVDDELDVQPLFEQRFRKEIKSGEFIFAFADSGENALTYLKQYEHEAVLILSDINMPGMSGLETLHEMKEKKSSTPVIMITKSEEEYIMEEAIGSKIADYLIKPVNPNQILLSLKKNLDHSRLISEKTTLDYQKEFRKIAMELNVVKTFEDWIELYKKLVYWEIELENIDDLCKRIDEAAHYTPIENLCVSPQCGFSSTHHGNDMNHDDQWRKLDLTVKTALKVWGEA
jgi:DNA-binding NtrC family response regulator